MRLILSKLGRVNTVPRLRAVTRPLAAPVDLLAYADAADPLVWLRDTRGFVGVGEVLRITATGPERFAELNRRWAEVAAAAEIDDAVQLPGSGLLALGAVSYSDASPETSVLIVPETLIHRHDDAWFITRVTPQTAGETGAGESRADPTLPPASAVAPWPGVALDPVLSEERAAHYQAAVRNLQRRFESGEAQKVVLARSISAPLPAGADLRTPLARFASEYLDCWTFAVDGLVGASPETLIRLVDGRATALVLAGTAPRHHGDHSADIAAKRFLETAPHIDQEHRLAAQSVIDTLTPHVAELTATDDARVLGLPNVWHRATDVTATPHPGTSALELVSRMHPTAAIAGTPTGVAVEIIAEVEPHDRGRYSGAVGWIDHSGDGEWAIALRCAQVADGTVTAWAGGGIVRGSDPLTELKETVVKFTPAVDAFR